MRVGGEIRMRAELLRLRDTAVEDMRAIVAHGDGSNTPVN